MKVRDLLRRMEGDGWYLARQRGSHRQMKHPDKAQTITIPGHTSDDFNPKTLQTILKQVGYKA